MEIILLERIKNVGNLGDKVKVRSGYGRNFLIPQGKAVFATEANLADFESRREELEQKAANSLQDSELRAEKINSLTVTVQALASDEGKLYGSVGVNEIAHAITATGINVAKHEIRLPDGPFHAIGEYEVAVQVNSDLTAKVKLTINATKRS